MLAFFSNHFFVGYEWLMWVKSLYFLRAFFRSKEAVKMLYVQGEWGVKELSKTFL